MDFWEFNIVYTDFEFIDERRLNALGDDRWELVSMAAVPHERFQFVFRRPQWRAPAPLAETMDASFPYTGDTIDIPPPFALVTTDTLAPFVLPSSTSALPSESAEEASSASLYSAETVDSLPPFLGETGDSLPTFRPDGEEGTQPDDLPPR